MHVAESSRTAAIRPSKILRISVISPRLAGTACRQVSDTFSAIMARRLTWFSLTNERAYEGSAGPVVEGTLREGPARYDGTRDDPARDDPDPPLYDLVSATDRGEAVEILDSGTCLDFFEICLPRPSVLDAVESGDPNRLRPLPKYKKQSELLEPRRIQTDILLDHRQTRRARGTENVRRRTIHVVPTVILGCTGLEGLLT